MGTERRCYWYAYSSSYVLAVTNVRLGSPIASPLFWIALICQLIIVAGYFWFYRKEQLCKLFSLAACKAQTDAVYSQAIVGSVRLSSLSVTYSPVSRLLTSSHLIACRTLLKEMITRAVYSPSRYTWT